MNPSQPQNLLAEAVQDHRRGQLDQALEKAGQARRAGVRWELESSVLIGEILFRCGRLGELGQFLDRELVLSQDPRGRMLRARWLARSGDLPGAESLLKEMMDSTDALFLYRMCAFERVQILTRQRRHTEAWELAADAHRQTTRPFNVGALVHALDQSLKWVRAGKFHGWSRAQRPLRRTGFIFGMPRSGTTLLEQMLDRHSRISAVGETPLLPTMADSIAESGGGWPLGVFTASPQLLDDWQRRYRQEIRGGNQIADKFWTLDKTVFPMLQPLVIGMVFPGAKVLRLVRHARDNATSLFLSNFDPSWGWTGSLDSIRQVIEAERRCVDTLLEAAEVDYLRLRYEDIVADPEANMRSALAHFGLPWEPQCTQPEGNTRTAMTLSHEQVRQPIHRGSIGRWREHAERFPPGWPEE